jgi:hypothetical protein
MIALQSMQSLAPGTIGSGTGYAMMAQEHGV